MGNNIPRMKLLHSTRVLVRGWTNNLGSRNTSPSVSIQFKETRVVITNSFVGFIPSPQSGNPAALMTADGQPTALGLTILNEAYQAVKLQVRQTREISVQVP